MLNLNQEIILSELSKIFFRPSELQCKCGCGSILFDSSFLTALHDACFHYGKKFNFTSCARCETHNAKVGGVPTSGHLSGGKHFCRAIDIYFSSVEDLYAILSATMQAKFNFIIVYRSLNFVHCELKSVDFRPRFFIVN